MYQRVHRNIGPKNGFSRCGKDIDGNGECWLCDVKIPQLRKKGKTVTAQKLEANGSFVCQVAIVDTESGEWRGPLTLTTSQGKSAKSLSYIMESLIQNTKRDFVSHKDGYNVTLERTGSGRNDTRYGTPVPDDEPTDVPKEIVARLKPFEAILFQYSEEQQKALYFGREYDSSEEEEKPKKKRPREEEEEEEESESEEESSEDEEEEEEKPKKKKKKPEPEEEEEEEEESEDESESEDEKEEEEEPTPKKKAKKKPVEEEEEEESEEEEEEPKPKKKKKPAVDEDEEEEETEEESEEEEEEPTPKKKKKKPVEEDEEEEETEEEEEEEEEPAPRRKKKH